MDPELRAFYEFHASLLEPWDGPAAIAFTDGRWSARRSTATGCGRRATSITEGGLGRPRLRGRRAGARRGDDPPQGPPDTGLAPARRHRRRHPPRRWRGQARPRRRTPLPLVDRRRGGPARRAPGRGRPAVRARRADPRARAHGVRLDRGGPPRGPRADGDHWGRGHRVHGQRHRPGRAARPTPAALHLLQAALRPGDQPADRPDPRGPRDVARHDARGGGQPLGAGPRPGAAPLAAPPGPHQRGHGDAAPRDPAARSRPPPCGPPSRGRREPSGSPRRSSA